MDSMMKFSIIVPVYNAQEYLQECGDSVLHQSYQNFELILVDDGSTDESGMICDRFAQQNPENIVVIHQKNQGPLLTRIHGLEYANGDVVVFLDADDCLRKDALEQLAECFFAKDCDVVLFNASDRDDFSNTNFGFPFQHLFTMEDAEKPLIYRMITYSKIPNALWLKAVKKHCFSELPSFNDLTYVRNGEDLVLSLYFLTAAKKIVYLDENLYFYRQREGSIVHSYNPDRARSIKTVHKELERFIDLWGMPELHPIHYARVVNAWVDALLILMDNHNSLDSEEYKKIMNAMAEDDYFRYAYESMHTGALIGKKRLLAKWLYRKRFINLQIAGFFRSIKNRI